MRILAIRGKNLASLSTEFAVDFRTEPLASAGLYAITGPTGAGKSTLLDALCLALYERTPRLVSAKGGDLPDVDQTLATSDPRTLLRRGTPEGFAEVEFTGSDGVDYRARWTVRRARTRAEGRLQATEMSLFRLADGQALGGTKSETLARIRAAIGLDFEQFTRAVLLAQNEFAAFLKANDDVRAELLQTLTGTDAFTRLSVAAYTRMKAENERLDGLSRQLGDAAPLPADERSRLEATQAGLATQQAEAERQKSALEAQQRWFSQEASLQAEVTQAANELAAAGAEKTAAAGRFAHLARVDAVQAARPHYLDEIRLNEDVTGADKALAAARTGEAKAITTREASLKALEAAQAELRTQAAKAEAARPALARARALDTHLATLAPQLGAAMQAAATSAEAAKREKTRAARTEKLLQDATREHAESTRWLEENASLRPLAEQWARWEVLLTQAAALRAEQTTQSRQLEQQVRALQAAEARRNAAKTTLAKQEQALGAASETLATATRAVAAFDPADISQRRKTATERREAVLAAQSLIARQNTHQQQRETLLAQQQRLTDARVADDKALQALDAARPALESARATAEQALAMARAAASKGAETLRAQLVPDHPCPVCGATTHPYADSAPEVRAMLDALKKHVDAAQKALDTHLAEQARTSERQKNTLSQLTATQAGLDALSIEAAGLEMAADALVLREELVTLERDARTTWLATALAAVHEASQAVERDASASQQAQAAKDRAQSDHNTAAQALAAAREALARCETEYVTLAQTVGHTQQRVATLDRELHRLLDQLDAAYTSPWRDAWRGDPQAFFDTSRARAGQWSATQQRQGELTRKQGELATALHGHADLVAAAENQARIDAARRDELQGQRDVAQKERAGLFDGAPLVDVEAALTSAHAQAQKTLDARQADTQTASAELAARTEGVRQTTEQLAARQAARQSARQALDQWLADFNAAMPSGATDAAELRELLAYDTAWITREREALGHIDATLTSRTAVLKVREKSLADHARGRPADVDAATVAAALAQHLQALAARAESLAATRIAIARDDERLATSAALREAIARQEAITRRWSQLGELIGSADGKKFRNFAQQLTLDILLGYANQHLYTLARRYRLERVADSLGLLVVDQDMGDEIRSVHSLSGGESFLVSLALALALASLSSHQVRVESLFIDEGFGSLDTASLMVAMDALENLQAQGRKVGVISHVQEMNERIGTRIEVRRQAGGMSRITVT